MHLFDIIIVLILAGFILNGIRRGFFHEAFGLIGVVGGVLVGILFAGPLSKIFLNVFPNFPDVALLLICFTLLFVAFYFINHGLANFFRSLSERIHLGWLNKMIGGILAGFKTAVFLSLIFMYISFLPIQKALAPLQKDSFFHKPLYNLVPELYKQLGSPEDLPEKVNEVLKKGREEMIQDALDDVKESMEDTFDDDGGR